MMVKKVLILLLVIIFTGYTIYSVVAQNEYSQGLKALETKDWLSAAIHFDRFEGYKFAFPSHANEIQELKDQSSLLVFGQSMREKGSYKEALDAYETFVYKFPKATTVEVVKQYFPAVYMDWGKSLREKSDFAGAIEIFESIHDRFPQSEVLESADEAEAKTYQAWGDELYKAKEYEAAIEKYEVVLTKFSRQSSELTREAEAKAYQTWADDLYEEKDFEKAVEKYKIVLTKFPTNSAADVVKEVQDDVYLQWADYLREDGQQDLALAKYDFIIENFKGSSSSTKAESELVPTKLEWAKTLHQNKEFEKEVDVLRGLLNDHKETPEAQQAGQEIITAYVSYGQQLIENKSFIKSMDTFTDAKEFALDEETQTRMDEGYKEAIEGLANDTGTDGAKMIDEALTAACAGEPVKSPVVGIQKSGPGKGLPCRGFLDMPEELTPAFPAEFKYVIDIEISVVDYRTCPYVVPGNPNTFKLINQRYLSKVTVINILTGKLKTFNNFYGPAPAACPQTRTFTSYTDTVVGDLVDPEQITKWLKTVIR